MTNEEPTKEIMVELLKEIFPKPEEELVDFLNWCKVSNSRTLLCPNWNVVYDEKVAKKINTLRKEEYGREEF